MSRARWRFFDARFFRPLPLILQSPCTGLREAPALKGGIGFEPDLGPLTGAKNLALQVVFKDSLRVSDESVELSATGSLFVTGTTESPRVTGDLTIDHGELTLFGLRSPIDVNSGRLHFDPDERPVAHTPIIELHGESLVVDTEEGTHTVRVDITGSLSALRMSLHGNEGWSDREICSLFLTGRTPQQLRKLLDPSPSIRRPEPIEPPGDYPPNPLPHSSS